MNCIVYHAKNDNLYFIYQESFTDATIACDGKLYPVHKLVISTCSDYFKEIFEKILVKCPVIILKDIKFQEIEALLDYMYIGEVDIKQNDLPGLIKAAECLKIKGLTAKEDGKGCSVTKKGLSDPKSPSAKRQRTESGNTDDPLYYYNKLCSTSPSSQHSVSLRPISTPSSMSSQQNITDISQPVTLTTHTKFDKECEDIDDQKPSHLIITGTHVDETHNNRNRELEKETISDNFSDYQTAASSKPEAQNVEMNSYNGTEIAGPSGIQGVSIYLFSFDNVIYKIGLLF